MKPMGQEVGISSVVVINISLYLPVILICVEIVLCFFSAIRDTVQREMYLIKLRICKKVKEPKTSFYKFQMFRNI